MILPMLSIVFWKGQMPLNVTTIFNSATLLGTVVGQVTFGVLADRYGRKKMYGLELLIVIFATLALALSSRGTANSINIVGWLAFWRLLVGFGIGGDYPLSAVITAEFAPRKHRARMLAAVFFMQPVGQLIANIVAIVSTAAYHHYISHDADPLDCTGECLQTTDKIWRWVAGIGAIPPAIAVLFRLFIPESPRYMLEVEMDSGTAVHDSNRYYRRSSVGDVEELTVIDNAQTTEMHLANQPPHQPDLQHQNDEIREYRAHLTVPPEPAGFASSSTQGSSGEIKDSVTVVGTAATSLRRSASIHSNGSVLSAISSIPPDPASEATNSQPAERPRARKPTWKQYQTGFYKYFIEDGNWTDLAGTASTWLLLDFSFYFLGVNSSQIIANIWGTSDTATVYEILMQNGWRALITTSIGAMVGGAIIIPMLFFNLGPNTTTFMIPAEVFPTQFRATCHGISAASGKVGSILAQIFLAYTKFNHKGVTDEHSTWLGWVLVVFTVFMISGAAITHFWVPNPCNIRGSSRSLETLALGKAHRKRLEEAERLADVNGS
ncbi:hypothetical protein FGG08_003720 [Glutinoglossum americanum]|uniref:Major facilitator superfamily (MFS) profile domain-containing protein n=1 Tax=Glutinoglossum americanum TaxID=1670608 RepID=A0A9P8L0C0_9PEZI|nr:hypothetical protein FGG08_003720 [Glutinoglossum americanum]